MASNKNKNKEKAVESAPVEQVFVPGNVKPENDGDKLIRLIGSVKEAVLDIDAGHREIDLSLVELSTLIARAESLAKFIKGAQDSVKKK